MSSPIKQSNFRFLHKSHIDFLRSKSLSYSSHEHYFINFQFKNFFNAIIESNIQSDYMHLVSNGNDEELLKLSYSYLDNVIKNGTSIIIRACNHFDDKVRLLDTELSLILNSTSLNMYYNCYLTPPYSNGFKRHSDDHDVYIYHIYGKKTWVIYDSFNGISSDGSVEIETNAGDALFIPMGLEHFAYTENEYSFHVTFHVQDALGF